jgi:hypothetical protein
MSGQLFSHGHPPQEKSTFPTRPNGGEAEVGLGGFSEACDIARGVAFYLYAEKCFVAVALDP